jgi:3-oxoadipate enol-lactonase
MKNIAYLLMFYVITSGYSGAWSRNDTPDIIDFQSQQTQVQSGFVEVENGKIYYERAGQGETIVLIHDGLVHHVIWEEQFPVFSKNYDVVRYDRRGYGRSPQPEKPYSNIEDLHQLFHQLNIDKAIVMGMSAGGGLAIDFTLAHPNRVASLVLVGAVVSGFTYTDHFFSRGGHLHPSTWNDPDAFRRYWYTDDPYEIAPQNTAVKERVRQIIEANPHDADLSKNRLILRPERPALGRLHEIKVPALIVVGEHDIPDVHAHAGAIEAGIPNARRIIISGAGHLVPLEQPEAFNEQVLQFLKEKSFFAILESKGIAEAVNMFLSSREKDPEAILFRENRMNQLGYQYLQSGNVEDAIEIFKLNVLAYPESWNVYDSLAEAYMNKGENALAIENYQKSLDLNPQNTGAIEQIEKLKNR